MGSYENICPCVQHERSALGHQSIQAHIFGHHWKTSTQLQAQNWPPYTITLWVN